MRPQVLDTRFESIPADLRAQKRWVLWRYTLRQTAKGETWSKVPYRAADGRQASSVEPGDWCSYDDAVMAYSLGDYDGLGFTLGDGYHGIDVDDCIGPDGSLSPLAQEVLQFDGYAETSPSGQGIKLITRTNMDRSQAKHSIGLETYTAGRYFTVTGHQLNGHAALPAEPVDLTGFVGKHFGAQRSAVVSGDAGFDIPKPPVAVSEAQMHSIMAAVTAAGKLDGNEDWIQVGMALHHQFSGSEDGLDVWDQYSSQAAGYMGRDDLAKQWARFDSTRGSGLTFARVWGWAKESGWVDDTRPATPEAVEAAAVASVTALTRYQAALATADYATITGPFAAEVKADIELSPVDRNVLVGNVRQRIKALQNTLPGIGEVRSMLARAEGSEDAPAWMAPWVFMSGENVFIHRVNKRRLGRLGFDGEYNRLLPGAGEAIVSASRQATESWDVLTVHGEKYLPAAPEVFEQSGIDYLNSYRHDLVPTGYWDAAIAAVLEEHLKLLVPKDWEREHLKRWMAWVARNPGKKALHAVLIKGTQGDGKSLLVRLMRSAMGGNVNLIDANAMQNSSFTEWSAEACLGVFEELRVAKDRYDVMDRLKPLITNPMIPLHAKGKAMVTVANTMNYMAFTNHDDGVPVDNEDRRWFVLFSPWRHRRDMEAAVGDPVTYWQRLSDAIDQAGAVRGWLDAVDLAGFNPFGAAPETEHKNRMIRAAKSDMSKAIQALLDAGDVVGVSRDVISTVHMEKALQEDGYHYNDLPKGKAVGYMMRELGYGEGPRVSIAGKRYRTWKRDGITDEAAIDWLRVTISTLSGF